MISENTQKPFPSVVGLTTNLYEKFQYALDEHAMSRDYNGEYGEYHSYLLSPEKRDANGNRYHDVYVLKDEKLKSFQSDLYAYLSAEYLNEPSSAYSDKEPPKIFELYDTADDFKGRVYVKHSQDPEKRNEFLRVFSARYHIGSAEISFDDLQAAVSKLPKTEQDRFYAYASQLLDARYGVDAQSEHSEHLSLYTNPTETNELLVDELVQRAINHPAAFNEPQHIFQTQDSRGNATTSFRFEPGQRYPFTAYNDPTQDPLIARAIETAHKDAYNEVASKQRELSKSQEYQHTATDTKQFVPQDFQLTQEQYQELQDGLQQFNDVMQRIDDLKQHFSTHPILKTVSTVGRAFGSGKALPNLAPAAARVIMPNAELLSSLVGANPIANAAKKVGVKIGEKIADLEENSLAVPKQKSGISR